MSRRNRAEATSVVTTTRLSPAERKRVGRAAKANHQTTSQFSRDALVTAADECLEEPIAQPVKPIRNTKSPRGLIL